MQELNYRDGGSGEHTLVFLHYFGGSSKTWAAVITLLKESFRCIAIDLPGFGYSAPLPTPANVQNVAVKTANFLSSLPIHNHVLIGHSMGGKIAMQLAAMLSSTATQLILIAPSPPTPEPANADKTKELLNAYGNRTALEKIAQDLVSKQLSDDALQKIVDDNLCIAETAWKDWITIGCQEDISASITQIRLPVTVITGEDDPNFSTSLLQKEIGGCLPQARFPELQKAGHLLPVEVPEILARKIADTAS